MQIGVIGPFGTTNGKIGRRFAKEMIRNAEIVGEMLAERGAVVMCGGDDKAGVIEAVARGVKRKNGMVVGFLVGSDKSRAMKYVDIAIPTGMWYGGREYVLVLSCDAVIVIGGGSGTLNEMTIAYQNNIPMIALSGSGGWADAFKGKYLDWRRRIKVESAESPAEAVEKAIKMAGKKLKEGVG